MAGKILRPIRIEGNIAYVSLTKGYEAIIDVADVPLVDGKHWSAYVKKWTVYAQHKVTPEDADTYGSRKTIAMHRAIMSAPKGIEVDHLDGNGLNNRRLNLRLATHSQNQQNKRIGPQNTSGVKGVSWNRPSNKWQVHIRVNGKSKNLGLFTEIADAAEAYARASAEYHGEFGRLE